VTLALCRELLALGGLDGRDPAEALRSGAAAERFAAMVAELGGPVDLLENPDKHLRAARVVREAHATEPGVVERVDVRAVGVAIIGLGGGRAKETDAVDHAVGLTDIAAPGEPVGPGERPLAVVHAADEGAADRAIAELRAAYELGGDAPSALPPVLETIST
jgi:thymidine phosphorylase